MRASAGFLLGATSVVGGHRHRRVGGPVRDVVLSERTGEGGRRAGRGRHREARARPEDRRRVARQGRVADQPHAGDARVAAEARVAARRPELEARRSSPPTRRTRRARSSRRSSCSVGICTHLGCSPTYRRDVAPADLGADWLGGFFCPCHQSKFDLAGRVYKGMPAPINLRGPAAQVSRPTRGSSSATIAASA